VEVRYKGVVRNCLRQTLFNVEAGVESEARVLFDVEVFVDRDGKGYVLEGSWSYCCQDTIEAKSRTLESIREKLSNRQAAARAGADIITDGMEVLPAGEEG